MVLSLLLMLLVLAVAFRQSTFGLFSALLMTVMTLCCAAAAIGLHEWAAINWLAPYWKPDYSYPIALAALFGIPLILVRLLFDQTITRACLLPVWLDRAGGAVCGLVTGLTTIGVLALCLQMIPFGRSILGYSAVNSYALDNPTDTAPTPPTGPDAIVRVSEPSRGLWLGPDRFATAVASLMSAGIFSGERNFYLDNPEFAEWISLVNAVPSEVSRFTKPGSISVESTGRVDSVFKMTPGDSRENRPDAYEPIDPPPGLQFRVVRLHLGPGARDGNKSLLFTLRQFRLVGARSDSGRTMSLMPVALQQEDKSQPINRHIYAIQRGSSLRPIVDDIFNPRDSGEHVEVVFAVPTNFEPRFIEYKRGARATLSFKATDPARGETAAPPAPPAQPESVASTEAPPTSRSGPRTRRVAAAPSESRFGDQLPMSMRSYRQMANVSIRGDTFSNGHIVGRVEQQESGSDPQLSRFAVPDDKRLLHLNAEFLRARSGLGRALSFAIGTVQNYNVTDANGNVHTLAGRYAIATVGGTEFVEVQYFPDQAGTMGSGQPFAEIKDSDLQGNYSLVLLFLVEPGVQIVSFSSGSAAMRGDNLRDQNLVAPQ